MNIVSTLEQEMKFIGDSDEGSRQYRKGYARALEVAAEFFSVATNANGVTLKKNPAVERLIAWVKAGNPFRAIAPKNEAQNAPCMVLPESAATDRANNTFDGLVLAVQETKMLRLALDVLRSNTDYSDFLNFWLSDYGTKIFSPNPPPLLPENSFEDQVVVVDGPSYIQ